MPEENQVSALQLTYELLDRTKAEVESLLTDPIYSLSKNTIVQNLTNLSNMLRGRARAPLTASEKKKFEPLTPAVPEKQEHVPTPAEHAGDELSDTVNAAYETFSGRPTDEILDSLNEMEIRGVARMAGMQVTETKPARVDAAFVEEIKQKIQTGEANKDLNENTDAAVEKQLEQAEKKLKAVQQDLETARTALGKAPNAPVRTRIEKKITDLETKEGELATHISVLNEALGHKD